MIVTAQSGRLRAVPGRTWRRSGDSSARLVGPHDAQGHRAAHKQCEWKRGGDTITRSGFRPCGDQAWRRQPSHGRDRL